VRATNAVRRNGAVPATRWALSRSPAPVLAEAWGVSKSRARHKRSEGENVVTESCALVTHPAIDGAAIVIAHLEALERRYLEEAKASPAKLRERLEHLIREAEHEAQARQDRALMAGEGVNAAILHHAHVLVEIAAIRNVLGLEAE
jgi:hypothetical protein